MSAQQPDQDDEQGRDLVMTDSEDGPHRLAEAREALARERERLQRIVAAAPGVFFSLRLEPNGVLSLPDATAAVAELFGVAADELSIDASSVFFAWLHPDDRARVQSAMEDSARTLMPWREECRFVHPHKGELWVEGYSLPMREQSGAVQWFGFLRDISERKHAAEAHLRAQKLEALGTLAGGIAHEFNNILQAITNQTALTLARLEPGHPARSFVDGIANASARAGDLVRRILRFSSPGERQPQLIALQAVIEDGLKFVRAILPAQIEIRVALDAEQLSVLADPAEIQQLLVNLATNAAHAIGSSGGEIHVSLEASDTCPVPHDLRRELHANAYAVLRITDDGCGIAPATLERIFDPFFTTKAAGQGAGLGLSVVHGIMKTLGGAVTASSELGRGSTFTLYFPLARAPSRPEAPEPEATEPTHGKRVLFVDDEELLVALGMHILESLGYEPVGCSRPLEALAQFEASPSAFDVVVTDLSMPGMSGFQLAQRIMTIRGDIPIVVMSGYLGPEERASAARIGVHELLLKPVTIDELGLALRRVLRNSQVSPSLHKS